MSSASPGRSPSPDHIDHETIRRHCAEVVHGFFEMINTRQFDPSRPFWTENTAPNYTYSGLHGDFGDVAVDLDRHLEMFEHYARIFPNFRLDMLDLFTEISPLDRKGEGVVRSVMNYRQVNCPAGVLKKSTAEFRWMRLEGEGEARPGRLVIWECRTVAGGGDMGG